MKKMKPDLYLWTFIAAGILLSPFIITYNVGKKLYDMTPARHVQRKYARRSMKPKNRKKNGKQKSRSLKKNLDWKTAVHKHFITTLTIIRTITATDTDT